MLDRRILDAAQARGLRRMAWLQVEHIRMLGDSSGFFDKFIGDTLQFCDLLG